MNNTTRKHPRTLNEAFGPYATGPLLEREIRRAIIAERVLLAVSIGGAIAAAVVFSIWG